MLRILDRYLLREVMQTWIAATVVLMVIFMSNRFARVLGDAAAGELPRDAVFALLGLTSIFYVLMVAPVGLFLGVMLALGRLYKDSEMAAMTAAGIGPGRLYRPLLLFAGLVAAGLAWVSLELAPWAAEQARVTKDRARQDAEIGILEPGRFKSADDGDAVFYAESVAPDGSLENLFIQRREDNLVQVAVAARGEQYRDPSTGQRTMILYDGQRIEGTPGSADFRVMWFEEHGIPIRIPEADADSTDRETFLTLDLLGSSDPEDIAELHWRLSTPLSAIVLTLLAVPLARTSPRQGRYGKLAIGILVYLLYANLLGAARLWVEDGTIPAQLGLWWIHAIYAALALLLVWWQNGQTLWVRGSEAVREREAAA